MISGITSQLDKESNRKGSWTQIKGRIIETMARQILTSKATVRWAITQHGPRYSPAPSSAFVLSAAGPAPQRWGPQATERQGLSTLLRVVKEASGRARRVEDLSLKASKRKTRSLRAARALPRVNPRTTPTRTISIESHLVVGA